jgi:predicted O-methyltransferase YrrM
MDMNGLSDHLDYCHDARKYFMMEPGSEHYKLCKYISLNYNDTIADVGTFKGASALALSANENIQVTTYDICDAINDSSGKKTPKDKENITFVISSCEEKIDEIVQSKIIFLDIDHSGATETWFVNKLVSLNYDGLLFLDDIYLNKEMYDFWENIPAHLKKIDLTDVGHVTGTGVVVFKPDVFDLVIE